MKSYCIDLRTNPKSIYSNHINFGGLNNKGDTFSCSNYYLELNDKPFFGISGEFHFSRYDQAFWEKEILKMKMCGINIISTYIFWIHHEEEQGVFDWTGNKNLRHFIELCGKHNMYVIIRIGPFSHGEARNGGIPDWLFGRPFELRSNDEEYLYFVKRLYTEIGKQVKGLLYKDGGPIIGTQIENEYMHAGAPIEMTTGLKHEWMTAGRDGEEHMKVLKKLAIECGIETPFYTCTAWGGAAAPVDEMLPLWGGYAFRPWIFTGEDDSTPKEHPATEEYIYRDYHNNSRPKCYNFDPSYLPEDYPYACCEMGGGMTVSYKYRFILPPESVEAMANIKAAGGCNFIGYYMFHGGSNPHGKCTQYLNEYVCPKISYDFQAPIGEFGQIREHYKMLKRLHYFFTDFSNAFCNTKTVLPYDTDHMDPHDVDTLRYAARVKDDSGFLFINNYQDHLETKEQKDFHFELTLGSKELRIPLKGELTLSNDCSCILPFNFYLDKICMIYSTAQLISFTEHDGEKYYFFFSPKGMNAEYCFDSSEIYDISVKNGISQKLSNKFVVHITNQHMGHIKLMSNAGNVFHICSLTNEQSMNFWKVNIFGKERFIISDANLLASNSQLTIECMNKSEIYLTTFPAIDETIALTGGTIKYKAEQDIFTTYMIEVEQKSIVLNYKLVSPSKMTIQFSPDDFEGIAELMLKIDYKGDIGYAFIDGKLINDNFNNGTTWEIGLMRFKKELIEKGMYIYISPLKKGAKVRYDSTMAAMSETADELIAEITSVKLEPVYELTLK